MLPIPKDAITANSAKSHASTEPSVLFLIPFFIVYIGPPLISPFSLTSRYFMASIHSENFEVRPNAAEIHIHTSAPGPPDTIAVATPTIFPVPIVAASAVVSAENGDTSPSPRFLVRASLLSVLLSAYPRFLHVRNLVRNVRKMPVPTNRISITGPQTKSSIVEIILLNFSIHHFLPFLQNAKRAICEPHRSSVLNYLVNVNLILISKIVKRNLTSSRTVNTKFTLAFLFSRF